MRMSQWTVGKCGVSMQIKGEHWCHFELQFIYFCLNLVTVSLWMIRNSSHRRLDFDTNMLVKFQQFGLHIVKC